MRKANQTLFRHPKLPGALSSFAMALLRHPGKIPRQGVRLHVSVAFLILLLSTLQTCICLGGCASPEAPVELTAEFCPGTEGYPTVQEKLRRDGKGTVLAGRATGKTFPESTHGVARVLNDHAYQGFELKGLGHRVLVLAAQDKDPSGHGYVIIETDVRVELIGVFIDAEGNRHEVFKRELDAGVYSINCNRAGLLDERPGD